MDASTLTALLGAWAQPVRHLLVHPQQCSVASMMMLKSYPWSSTSHRHQRQCHVPCSQRACCCQEQAVSALAHSPSPCQALPTPTHGIGFRAAYPCMHVLYLYLQPQHATQALHPRCTQLPTMNNSATANPETFYTINNLQAVSKARGKRQGDGPACLPSIMLQ